MNDKLLYLREQLLQEAYSGSVFYWAKPTMNFLKENRIALTPFFMDDDAIEKEPSAKKKLYFISTSRIKFGGYSLSNFNENNIGVIVELDGGVLSYTMKSKPIDYWGKDFRKYEGINPEETKYRRMVNNENEERFYSDNPYLQPLSKYVKNIFVYCPKFNEHDYDKLDEKDIKNRNFIREMSEKAEALGVTMLITDNSSEFKVLRGKTFKQEKSYKNKYATLVKAIKEGKAPQDNSLKEFREYQGQVDSYGKNSSYAQRTLKELTKDMKYQLGSFRAKNKELIHETLALMKKYNKKDFESFITWASEYLYGKKQEAEK